MSTFITSLILILLGIAMFYPLFFTIINKNFQDENNSRRFLRLNYILHLLAGAFAVLLLWIYRVNYPLQLSGVVYLLVIFVVVLYYWKSPIPQWNLFTASVIFGFIVFYRSFNEIVEITPIWPGLFTGLISVWTISIVIFLVVLSLQRLAQERALGDLTSSLSKYFIVLISIRIAWDIVILFNLSVETQYGEIISALKFFWQADSLKLILMTLFGLIIPALFYFIFRKRLGMPDSKYRFWILLFLFISTLVGDFLFKYFLLQYGIVL